MNKLEDKCLPISNKIQEPPKISDLDWKKGGGLIPAIVQDYFSGRVLMLGYVNQESMERTLATSRVTFFSRSRNTIWEKGETSGNTLQLVRWAIDCDSDTILILAKPDGPTCHTGQVSCFGNGASGAWGFLEELEAHLEIRRQDSTGQSYTAKLLESGIRRVAQKVGEEGIETVIAAVSGDKGDLANETADLIYHLLVLLLARGMSWKDVLEVLAQRKK
ncbi:MAG: bifunctional phosphoribosyl-AMP cyclohydrolase/phosphoribosyl-ATP diphosphatase HisIE [Bdellovibrionales bacterium]|nr:bifunctional phosphoribosyl-AMP cyclohydrolase/phosphoribosyl-ATP diphosphatase HisIE [Bdellovibrionales bacterium]